MARSVIVENVHGPIGQGSSEKAVRTIAADDGPAAAQARSTNEYLALVLTELRVTNLLLAQAFNITDDLDALRRGQGDA